MERFFKLKEMGTTDSTEIAAGITTFLAMAYILAVNPGILSESGMDFGRVFTATAVSAAIATLCMAFLANLPVALAPGMGLNAFFTYTVVMGMGCTWQFALTAVLVEGILFILLSLFGVREAIIRSIPANLKKAVAVGIGLFIALIGLSNAQVTSSSLGTIIGFVTLNGENASAMTAILGLVVTIILYVLRVPGSILIGIAITTIIGIPFGVTKIPEEFHVLSIPAAPYFFEFEWANVLTFTFFIVFFTFLFTDIFDTIGTLMGVSEQAGLTDKDGNIPNAKNALLSDAIGTVAGAALGTSTVTSFVESSSGVAVGGRTGLASVVTAAFFLLALFFSEVFALIPSAATAPALIFVGFLMMKSVSSIDFSDLTEGIPAFITIIVMPFGYSIAKGICWGILAYVLCKVTSRRAKEVPAFTWILAAFFAFDLVFEALK